MTTLTRTIAGHAVYPIGFGCMNLSHGYGEPPPRERAVAVLHRALDLGMNHFDTAVLYGFGRNEALVGPALKPFRDRIFLASKCGVHGVDGVRVIDGRPETLTQTLEESLRRLDTEVIDLYYLHRWDKSVPIEDSIGAMARMVEQGKVRALGLSEVSAATLRKAHAVHPIAAVQTEYSLCSRNPEIAVLDACAEIGAAFVAFSPLSRGFLSDTDMDPGALVAGDFRRQLPRFQEPAFTANTRLLESFRALARELGCSAAQLALAWVLHQAPHVLALPGTTSVAHLEDDVAAAGLALSAETLARLDALINQRTVAGPRYPATSQAEVDTEQFAPV
jgi:aryl-alcohol dehydrogenase-like predicted oxidoreductase